jgi:hypothetical protein
VDNLNDSNFPSILLDLAWYLFISIGVMRLKRRILVQ